MGGQVIVICRLLQSANCCVLFDLTRQSIKGFNNNGYITQYKLLLVSIIHVENLKEVVKIPVHMKLAEQQNGRTK